MFGGKGRLDALDAIITRQDEELTALRQRDSELQTYIDDQITSVRHSIGHRVTHIHLNKKLKELGHDPTVEEPEETEE
jgi:hypothetical protein